MNQRDLLAAALAPLVVPGAQFGKDLLGYAQQSPAHLSKAVEMVVFTTLPFSYALSTLLGIPLLVALWRSTRPRMTLLGALWAGGWTFVGMVLVLQNPGPDGAPDWGAALLIGAVLGVLGCVQTLAFYLLAGPRRGTVPPPHST